MDDPIQRNGRTWTQDQEWETRWWGDCTNTFSEENKQISVAHRIGLVNEPDPYTGAWPSYDLAGRSVVDIGGGPVSLLLKCRNRGRCAVVDPAPYPDWVDARYHAAGIVRYTEAAEDLDAWLEYPSAHFDEAWAYNVCQHTKDPQAVIDNARRASRVLRIFEWIDTPPMPGHPHTLTVDALEHWCGGMGTVENINENGNVGRCWFGVFGGDS